MTVTFDIDIFDDVSVDGDGDIEFTTMGSYHGEDVYRQFSASDLEVIATRARAHQAAYQAYRDRDYEDDDKYHSDFAELTV